MQSLNEKFMRDEETDAEADKSFIKDHQHSNVKSLIL